MMPTVQLVSASILAVLLRWRLRCEPCNECTVTRRASDTFRAHIDACVYELCTALETSSNSAVPGPSAADFRRALQGVAGGTRAVHTVTPQVPESCSRRFCSRCPRSRWPAAPPPMPLRGYCWPAVEAAHRLVRRGGVC